MVFTFKTVYHPVLQLNCLDSYGFLVDGRERGFKNLYSLKGGVSHYLENEGPVEWIGNLFVFDSRLSLPPSSYKTEAASESSDHHSQVSESSSSSSSSTTFAICYICSSQIHELRHRNCANLDCNLLFL